MKMLLLSNVSHADTPTSQIQMAQALCGRHSILYVDTLGNRGIGGGGSRDMKKVLSRACRFARGTYHLEGGLWAMSPLAQPGPSSRASRHWDEFFLRPQLEWAMSRAGVKTPDVLWIASPSGIRIACLMPEVPLVYYCTDDTAAFPAVEAAAVLADEKAILKRACLVVAVSEGLRDALVQRGAGNVLVLENGVLTSLFESPPSDALEVARLLMANLSGGKVALLAGTLDDRSNLDLLGDVVERLPDVEFVVAGPVMPSHSGHLPKAGNLHYLGIQPHKVVAALVSLGDVCIAPYADTDVVRRSSPLKVMEYLAAGKPVVATPVTPLMPLSDVISLADDGPSFASSITALLGEAAGLSAVRRARVKDRSWDAVALRFEIAVETVLSGGRESDG